MNELQNYKETVTMTSLEIAELTGKEHKNVLRDIEDEIVKLGELFTHLKFEGNNTELIFELSKYKDPTGRMLPMYQLTRKGIMQLGARYDAKIRYALISKLEEMEHTARYQGLPNFCNPVEAARAWVDEIDRNKALETKIAADTPKVEYYNQLVDKNMLTSFRDTAKELGVKEKAFICYILTRGFVYRDRKGKLKPYAQYSNLFSIKEYINDTTGRVGNQTFVTPKGREHLLELLDDPSVQHYLTCSTK